MKSTWECELLGNVTSIDSGIGFPINYQGLKKSEGLHPFYKVGDISRTVLAGARELTDAENYVSSETAKVLRGKLLPKGTVVFAKIGEALKLNRRAIVKTPSLVDNNVCAIKASDRLDDLFLYYFLVATKFDDLSRATTVPSLRKSDLEQIKIPLPSLPVQRKIVAKIEELFSDLDAGVESLKMAQTQLKVYRQSVLKAAFEGKLTAEWRAKQKKLPTAQELLATIQAERQAHYETKLKEWKTATTQWEKGGKVGKKPSKPSAPEAMVPLTKVELKDLPKLPEGWAWCRLGELIFSIDAGKSYRCDERPPQGKEIGIAKVSAVTWGVYNEDESKTITDDGLFNEDYLIRQGDFILSRANTIELVGACVIASNVTKKIMLSDKTLRLRFFIKNQHYLLHFLRSKLGRKQIAELSSGNQESMRNIGQERLRSIVVPICSENEQLKLLDILEAQLSEQESASSVATNAISGSNAFRQSILKRAFEGKLV